METQDAAAKIGGSSNLRRRGITVGPSPSRQSFEETEEKKEMSVPPRSPGMSPKILALTSTWNNKAKENHEKQNNQNKTSTNGERSPLTAYKRPSVISPDVFRKSSTFNPTTTPNLPDGSSNSTPFRSPSTPVPTNISSASVDQNKTELNNPIKNRKSRSMTRSLVDAFNQVAEFQRKNSSSSLANDMLSDVTKSEAPHFFQLDSNNNIIYNYGEHSFIKQHFKEPSLCMVCNDYIWGVNASGFKCGECDEAVHSHCLQFVPEKKAARGKVQRKKLRKVEHPRFMFERTERTQR